ncbi:hypothetical protein SELMODRAFT_419987 [Selaginella moellendorffii]|uniref:Uncharacterized protein n=1 Tax=Selaginella moellendorffii TaxID=88036 RepID=D8SA72_SELML|nr:hypothetical protein SELMODRAFT_419987 [Selaginella moellendorffii]
MVAAHLDADLYQPAQSHQPTCHSYSFYPESIRRSINSPDALQKRVQRRSQAVAPRRGIASGSRVGEYEAGGDKSLSLLSKQRNKASPKTALKGLAKDMSLIGAAFDKPPTVSQRRTEKQGDCRKHKEAFREAGNHAGILAELLENNIHQGPKSARIYRHSLKAT